MPRRELSQDELQAFRARALDCAEALFVEAGVDGVTMRAVASRLGCSPMTTYRYFEDREALIAALRATVFARFADALEAAPGRRRSPLMRIEALRSAYVDFARTDPDGYRLMFALRPPARPDAELQRQAERAFAPLKGVVAEAVAAGDLEGDPDVVAHLVWVELHGLVSLYLADKLIFGRELGELLKASVWTKRRRR